MSEGPPVPPGDHVLLVGEGEPKNIFRHPLTGREIQWSENDPPEARLRRLSDPSAMPGGSYPRQIFDLLFPSEIPVHPFNERALQINDRAALTQQQRNARRALLSEYGFRSLSKDELVSADDNPGLYVGFRGGQETLAGMLLGLDTVKRQDGTSQTDQLLSMKPPEVLKELGVQKVSRLDHAKHFALNIGRTLSRLEMRQPREFLRCVKQQDLPMYEELYKQWTEEKVRFDIRPSGETKRIVDRIILEHLGSVDAQTRESLLVGYEYGKYLVTYAFLHDMETPGWGDVFMKTRARVAGQADVAFSEDAELASIAFDLPEDLYLSRVIRDHGMNPKLLSVMVRSLALEQDQGLAGYLMKDKRKAVPKGSVVPPFPSLDGDQESGTITNMEHMSRLYFPGGFRHQRKGQETPIGDTEERARLFMYQALTGMEKGILERAALDLGLDPQRIFFTAEEMMISPNIVLAEYGQGDDATIIPVSSEPGDVKRLSLILNVAYGGFYMSPTRAPIQLLTQDAIAFGMDNGLLSDDVFRDRGDLEVTRRLNRLAKFIPYGLERLQKEAEVSILTEEDLSRLGEDALANCLVTEAPPPQFVNRKEGTLTIDYRGQIDVAKETLRIRLSDKVNGVSKENPLSTPKRLENVQEFLAHARTFYVIRLNDTQVEYFRTYLTRPQNEKALDVLQKTLTIWTKPLTVGDKTITPPLRHVFAVG